MSQDKHHQKNDTAFFGTQENSQKNNIQHHQIKETAFFTESNKNAKPKLKAILHKFKKNQLPNQEYSFFTKMPKVDPKIINNTISEIHLDQLAISKDIQDNLIFQMPNMEFKKQQINTTKSNLQNSTTTHKIDLENI